MPISTVIDLANPIARPTTFLKNIKKKKNKKKNKNYK
jgi:hypothetical protein